MSTQPAPTAASSVPAATGLDAYAPPQIARRVELAGVAKVRLPPLSVLTLAVLAGAFIAFGGMLYTVVMTEPGLSFGPSRLLGGVAFSLGLILVVVAGAELFTGNTLIVMAWVERKVTLAELGRNWALVYVGNLIGALGAAVLVLLADGHSLGDGKVGTTAASIALGKLSLPWSVLFFRGILCNALVCLAVWLTFAARDVTGKILAILFPIAGFVTLGLEHSIANMYLIGVAWLAGVEGVTLLRFVASLVPVTLGNIVGGGVLVGGVYWLCYRQTGTA